MSTLPKSHLTAEEYLAIERKAEYKSEYSDGQMLAMSGARRAHNIITVNAAGELNQQLRSRPCGVYSNDMRVCVDRVKEYSYPDVVVAYGEPKFLDGEFDTLLNPVLIVEVLSPSTEFYDRNLKIARYRSIESLQSYLLISSDLVHAELYTRDPSGGWYVTDADELEDVLELRSIGCTLKLADLYHKVEF